MNKARLYVANLHYDAGTEDMKQFFSQYGKVKDAQVITDGESGRSRGFGFVEMNIPVEAERALAANGEEMMGRRLKVAYAQDKRR